MHNAVNIQKFLGSIVSGEKFVVSLLHTNSSGGKYFLKESDIVTHLMSVYLLSIIFLFCITQARHSPQEK
jgi:hypothetical protein